MSTQQITDQDFEDQRLAAVNGTMYKTFVEVELNELIDRPLEDILQLVSVRATGSPLLRDTRFTVVDFKEALPHPNPTLVLEVRGDTTAIVAEVEANR